MSKILKHFGLGNKKTSSPSHKCKLDSPSRAINTSNDVVNCKENGLQESSIHNGTKDNYSDEVITHPNHIDVQPVYSAVIKNRSNNDTLENSRNVFDMKQQLIDNLPNLDESKTPENEIPDSTPTAAAYSAPYEFKRRLKSEFNSFGKKSSVEYDDPYDEGPMLLANLDSGMSSLKSSCATIFNNDDDNVSRASISTEMGFDTLKAFNSDRGEYNNVASGTCGKNIDDLKPILPPKTYPRSQDCRSSSPLPPPPPENNYIDLKEDYAPHLRNQRASMPSNMFDQPWDLSKSQKDVRHDNYSVSATNIDVSDSIDCNGGYKSSLGSLSAGWNGPPPIRHESLMMRSAYAPDMSSRGRVPAHQRSISMRSVDYNQTWNGEDQWDQSLAYFQTVPDGHRGGYAVMGSQKEGYMNSSWVPSLNTQRIDPRVPLEQQIWYHGNIGRIDAENLLRYQSEGSYLLRNSESNRLDYSLSIKSSRGFMHLKVVPNHEGRYILGQFSKPFINIPQMILYYSEHKLPIKGAEHMSLIYPIGHELL